MFCYQSLGLQSWSLVSFCDGHRHFLSQPHFGAKCENATHTPKSGKMESFGTSENLEADLRGQISLHWYVFYINEKLLKRRCPKWHCMGHLDIWSSSYGQKKGQESNWQFDFRPLKVGNWPLPDIASRSATWRWKALDNSYNFGSNLVPIWVRGEELWASKVLGLQPGTVSGLQLGSPGKKSHSDVASAVRHKEYYMGKVVASPEFGPWWVLCVKVPVACPNTQGCSRMLTNSLVVSFGCRFKLDNLVHLPNLILGLLARPSTPF